ncbi:MAG: hypothetical protein KAR22_25610 [Gammaproteobacteria bacterium]|nr:hypothetical protein [Gammaproteobacteria bacterium]
MVAGPCELGAVRGKARLIPGKSVAQACVVCGKHLLGADEGHWLEGHIVCSEIIDQVELRGRVPGDTDLRPVEIEHAVETGGGARHKSLAVVVVHANEVDRQLGVPGECPCGVSNQDIDLACTQGGEAISSRQRDKSDCVGIAEGGCSHRPAKIHVNAGPLALCVGD